MLSSLFQHAWSELREDLPLNLPALMFANAGFHQIGPEITSMTCIMYCYVFTHLDQDEEKCTYVEEKKVSPSC